MDLKVKDYQKTTTVRDDVGESLKLLEDSIAGVIMRSQLLYIC